MRAGAPIKVPPYPFLNAEETPLPLVLPPAPQFGEPVPQDAVPEVLRFLALRRSSSAVALGDPAPAPEEIETLLRLAARVPDHGKLSPWRFIILQGDDKAAFAARLEAVALSRGDPTAAAKLAKLKIPPLCVAVIASPKAGKIPVWEQQLSAGAVCVTLLYATLALGYGANWITDWYAYDADANAFLGLTGDEKVAGFLMIGTPREPPHERERPDMNGLVSHWRNDI